MSAPIFEKAPVSAEDALRSSPTEDPKQPRQPLWVAQSAEEIRQLMNLPDNWDSYGGKRVSQAIAAKASLLLMQLAGPETPRPSVVPTVRGGIQVEWHVRGAELEIELISAERMIVSFEDPRGSVEWDRDLPVSDVDSLAPAIARISAK